MLQGLPGVGPALAHRLLLEFGSVERVVTADEASLVKVRGVGAKTAARIRELVCMQAVHLWNLDDASGERRNGS